MQLKKFNCKICMFIENWNHKTTGEVKQVSKNIHLNVCNKILQIKEVIKIVHELKFKNIWFIVFFRKYFLKYKKRNIKKKKRVNFLRKVIFIIVCCCTFPFKKTYNFKERKRLANRINFVKLYINLISQLTFQLFRLENK